MNTHTLRITLKDKHTKLLSHVTIPLSKTLQELDIDMDTQEIIKMNVEI